MREQESSFPKHDLEGAAFAREVLGSSLTVKTGPETSREDIMQAAQNKNLIVTFVITENFNIWLSTKLHDEILLVNGLHHSYAQDIEGYTGFRNDDVGMKYYDTRGKFGTVFHALKEKSGLPEEEFTTICKEVVKQKIRAFLREQP